MQSKMAEFTSAPLKTNEFTDFPCILTLLVSEYFKSSRKGNKSVSTIFV